MITQIAGVVVGVPVALGGAAMIYGGNYALKQLPNIQTMNDPRGLVPITPEYKKRLELQFYALVIGGVLTVMGGLGIVYLGFEYTK